MKPPRSGRSLCWRALRLLADSGFGGERSRGWGRAEIDPIRNVPSSLHACYREADGGNGWWMLSLFHPAGDDAVDWQRGNYAVTTRGGRVESDAGWGDMRNDPRA